MIPIDFQKRRTRLSMKVKEKGFDAYLVTRQGGLHYLCGVFMPWRGVAIVTANNQFALIYWTGDATRIIQEGAPMEVIEFNNSDMFEKTKAKLREFGLTSGKLAFDLALPGNAQPAPGMMTAAEYIEAQTTFKDFQICNGVTCLDELLMIKDEAELERLRKAASIADYAYDTALKNIHTGMTENQIAGILEHASRDKGSYWAWSVTAGTEVGSGPRTAFAHGVTQISSERRIQQNEFIIIDFHPCYDLYLCDYSIPAFIGTPNEQQKILIDCWEEALKTVFDAILSIPF